MNDLVRQHGKSIYVSTFSLFEKMGYKEHRTLKRVIRENKSAFDDLGFLHLEVTKPNKKSRGGRPEESYMLTEDHFILLILLAKNSKESLLLKIRVSKEFRRMKKQLARIASQQENEQWKEIRQSGKIDRRIETDVIKIFIEYAIEQGSKSASLYYMNISKMENKALFIVEQKYKNLRDVLGGTDLLTIQQADRIVGKALQDGMNDKLFYKDIYKLAKERVIMFAEIRGTSVLGYLTNDKTTTGQLLR